MTKAEQIFLARMIPHIQAGMSLEEAGRAVLADDERIWLAATADNETGEEIRTTLAAEIYQRLRAA